MQIPVPGLGSCHAHSLLVGLLAAYVLVETGVVLQGLKRWARQWRTKR